MPGNTEETFSLANNDSIAGSTAQQTQPNSSEGIFLDFSNGENFNALQGNDTIIGSFTDDTLSGDSGNDLIFGNQGDDILDGNEGDDSVYGGANNDTVRGGSGNDRLFGDANNNGRSALLDPFGNDYLQGGLGNDEIHGNQGRDTLDGEGGNDTLYGGQDSDILLGADGSDLLYGNNHNDTVYGSTGDDTAFGDAGDDVVYGEEGNDFIDGGQGNDTLSGGSGNDLIRGDLLEQGESPFQAVSLPFNLIELQVNDLLFGEDGNDTLIGGANNDLLFGNTDNDVLYGNQGTDTVYGGQGNDLVYGGQNNDLLFGDKGDDTLSADEGNDTAFGGEGNDVIFGIAGNNVLGGNQGNDILVGGAGDETLQGGKDNDSLVGNEGNDVLDGDLGSDTLRGGQGSDKFVLREGISNFDPAQANLVTDFTDGEDFIQLTGRLRFEDVDIRQGINENAGNTVVRELLTGNVIILQGVNASTIDRSDFLPPPPPPPPPPAPPGGDSGLPPLEEPPAIDPTPTDPTEPELPDEPGTLQFGAANFQVNEDGTPVTAVTIIRTGGDLGAVGASLSLSNGTATSPDDYQDAPISVEFQDGQTSQTIAIPITQDELAEGDETINLSLANPTGGASIGAQRTATLTIVDDEVPGNLAFSSPTYTVLEDDSTALVVTVTRSNGSDGVLEATVTLSDGPANPNATPPVDAATGGSEPFAAGVDYNNSAIGVSFADGDTAPKQIRIPVNADALPENNETLTLTLVGPRVGQTTEAVLTIEDDDDPDRTILQFTGATYSYAEDGTPTDAQVTVSRSGNLTAGATVDVNFANGTGAEGATGGTDFTAAGVDFNNTVQTLTFAPNETEKTVNISINDDTDAEANELFQASLVNPTSTDATVIAAVGPQSTAEIEIVDNDLPVVTIAATTPNASEDGNAGRFTITRQDSLGNPIVNDGNPLTVTYSVGGSANSGEDFDPITGTVTIAANQADATIDITPIDDSESELDEIIELTLTGGPPDYTIGDEENASVTIADNDIPTVFISPTDPEAAEGGPEGNGQFTLRRLGDKRDALTVGYSVSDLSSATPGVDFEALAGTATIPAGTDRATINISPLDDGIPTGSNPGEESFVETVILELTPTTFPPYDVGGSGVGTLILFNYP
jgi:Ca2+-binding RTX toxin-like protein